MELVANAISTSQWATYLDTTEVTEWLQFAGTTVSHPNILQRVIDAACWRAQEMANRPLGPTLFQERHDGWSGEYIMLRYTPFLELVSCVEWQSAGGPIQLLESTPQNPVDGVQIDYATSRIMRTFAGYSWPRPFFPGSRNIEISYKAGFNPVPPDIWEATVDLVAYWWRNTQQASRGLKAPNPYGDTGEASNDLWPGMPDRIGDVFKQYRMPSIA